MNQPLFNAGNKNLIKILTYLNFVVFDTSLLEIFKYCFFLESWRILFFKCLHNLNQHKPHTVYNKVFMRLIQITSLQQIRLAQKHYILHNMYIIHQSSTIGLARIANFFDSIVTHGIKETKFLMHHHLIHHNHNSSSHNKIFTDFFLIFNVYICTMYINLLMVPFEYYAKFATSAVAI